MLKRAKPWSGPVRDDERRECGSNLRRWLANATCCVNTHVSFPGLFWRKLEESTFDELAAEEDAPKVGPAVVVDNKPNGKYEPVETIKNVVSHELHLAHDYA